MKESLKSFLKDIFAVVLGIFITFTVQGMIDRSTDRKNVRSSLRLVRSELVQNIEDISIMKDYIQMEKDAAEYFLAKKDSLEKCPADTFNFYAGMLFADVSFTLCEDALELLKMSSVFQKIGNNELSMKIIRAYDTCASILEGLNRHISTRDAMFENSIDKETVGDITANGGIELKRFLKTEYGKFSIKWIAVQPYPGSSMDVADIEEAVAAIDAYLGVRPRKAQNSEDID